MARQPDRDHAAPATAPPGRWRLWGVRLGWLLLLWTLGVAALAVLAGLLRLFMHALGMR